MQIRTLASRFLFRLGAAVLLALIFLQPSFERRVRMSSVPVAIVVDSSESMAASDAGPDENVRRWDFARAALSRERERLEKNLSPAYHLLDQKARPASWEDLSQAAPKGALSDVSRLEDVLKLSPEARAVVFFSDGRNGGRRDPAAVAASLGVPVYAVGVGKEESAPDLILDSVRAPRLAFKNTDVDVSIQVSARRLNPGFVTARIVQGSQTVASQRISLPEASNIVEATMTFRPQSTGLQAYHVQLPVYDAETNRRNNRQDFTVQVARDRIRVLYISGQPSPQYSLLRHQLKTNPSVELVSFVILRDPEDAVNIPDYQLALIPFPSQEALFEQLKTFDLLIFEQFSFSQFGIGAGGLALIREYVEKGGGLLLVGNSRVLGPAGPYRQTPLDDLLPLSLEEPLVAGPRRYRMDVLEPEHPVMALTDRREETVSSWRTLPFLVDDGQFLPRAKKGALTLAMAGQQPVMAAWQRGRGRVMMFLSLSSWRWALGEAGLGQGAWMYQRFWSNAVRWLSSSEDFRLVRMELAAESTEEGEELSIRAFVNDENHKPLDAAEVQAQVNGPKGLAWRKTLKPVNRGEYGDVLTALEPGAYRVTVQAYHHQKKLGEDKGVVELGALWDENRDTSTNFPLLRNMAQVSGGDFIPCRDFSSSWLDHRLEPVTWTYEKRESPWNSAWVLILLTGLLFLEWFRQRKYE
ncbi:MAG: hypothetical protein HY548_07435 [Elusimicrobia bacterium]|nr:hypothetical protein [Elusimicrobiota bacterium]